MQRAPLDAHASAVPDRTAAALQRRPPVRWDTHLGEVREPLERAFHAPIAVPPQEAAACQPDALRAAAKHVVPRHVVGHR